MKNKIIFYNKQAISFSIFLFIYLGFQIIFVSGSKLFQSGIPRVRKG